MSHATQHASVIWITGLSKSGKTTLAQGTKSWLETNGNKVQILDGSFVRDEVGGFFGYSREERLKVSRLLSVMSRLLVDNGIHVIVTAITPYQESRDFNKSTLPNYFEIYLECSTEICKERDNSGLYAKAERGDLKHVVGVDSPFELPKTCDLKIPTSTTNIETTLATTIDILGSRFAE